MADYFQVKNQNIFNPPANTSLGNASNQFNDVYVQNDLVLGNVTVTGTTIIAPRITTITYPGDDTAADTAGGQTITLTGTGFVAGANLLINGSAVGVVSVVSSTTITFTSPANTTGSYVIYVINPDGSTAIAIPGIQYSGTPTWTTAAGTLGNVYETANFTQTVTATGDAPITYSVVSGSLPPGSTFNANGTITGTSQLSASPTTYSFTVRATDAEQQDTNRAFSIAVIPDVVTWSNPTNNTSYSPAANVPIANITLSATSAVGSGITYSANTLPTGLSLTGANISGTPTVSASTSSLLTATANTTSESSSITINWIVSVASDPYFMYNSLLLPGTGTNGAQNNTFLDASTNNFTITRAGNTTQGTFSPYGPNWSNYFDGNGDYLSVPASSAFIDIATTQYFTVECWVYRTVGGTEQYLWSNRGALSGWEWRINSTNLMQFFVTAGSSMTSTGTIPVNTWTHLAFSRESNTTRFFINGALDSTTTFANGTNATGIALYLGYGTEGGGYFPGYMSNARLIKGTALYTSAFTPPTAPLGAIANTSLLTCQSNRFIDNSSNNLTITKNGDVSVQRFSPFSPTAAYSSSTIGGSAYFDGTGDYLSTTYNSAFAITSNAFTAEAWVYPITIGAGWQTIAGVWDSANGTQWIIQYNSSGARFFINTGSFTPFTASMTLTANQWYHIVTQRDGSNIASIYINGSRISTGSYTSTGVSSTAALNIGRNGDNSEYMSGYMTDFKFVKNSAIYSGATITVPTSPATTSNSPAVLTNFTNAGIIDNTMINNLETVGNAQISTAQTKFGGGSMSFDGTGDYLKFASSQNLAMTGDFTIEMWIYPNNWTGSNVGVVSGASNSIQISSYGGFGTFGVAIQGVEWIISNASLPTTSTWFHLAVTRSGTSVKIFLNGTQSGSTGTSAQSFTPITIVGFADGGTAFNGYIDDLRITKGYARYTSNFTPPTSAYPIF